MRVNHLLNVEDVRDILTEKLFDDEFVIDKNGGRVIEIPAATFVANEVSVFGSVNFDWHQRELAWYESQSLNVNDIPAPIPEIWKQVADRDGFINSNYGWCVWSESNGRQYDRVVRELKTNPQSRRAVMIYTRPSMWDDYDTNGRSDFMCTSSVQYMIRNNKLHAIVQMRSSDLIFGYKGDRFWQQHVLNMLAADLDIEPGHIIWHAGSAHVYERHFYLIDWWKQTGELTVTKDIYRKYNEGSEWAK